MLVSVTTILPGMRSSLNALARLRPDDALHAKAYDFLLEVALHGAIYTGPDPEATIAYLRDQAEDAMEM